MNDMVVQRSGRFLEITTPLDSPETPASDRVLQFHSFSGTEALGRPFEYSVEVLSKKHDVDGNKLLGKTVNVKLELPGGSARHFDGYVTRFALIGTVGAYHQYQMAVRPWLWVLTRSSDCRVFQQMTVPEIIDEIFDKYRGIAKVENKLTATYPKWQYCVQYRETDFNFVSRLMEQEGIYYYFKHEKDKHTLVLADACSAHTPFPGYESIPYISLDRASRLEQEFVSDWNFGREVQPGAFVLKDFNFETPQADLLVMKRAEREHAESSHEYFDYPGEYLQKDEGQQYVQTRLEELQAQHEYGEGTSNARGICVGSLFKLTRHARPDQNKEYLLVRASYRMSYNSYEAMDGATAEYTCNFSVLDAQQPFRTAPTTPKPRVQGPQTAIVVGPPGDEIHTDEHGRVRVKFHWDRHHGGDYKKCSCWIRVSHPWAGKGWGSVSIPRIGQEVVVDFLEGDPDQPIITGRVYNADNRAPFSLPGDAVVSGLKTNTHKGKGYNEMSMNDTAGKEKITIHGQYDMNTTVQHDQTNTVNNDFTETIKKNAKITISEGTYNHDVATGTAAYHVKSALTEHYDATQDTTVKGNLTIKSTGGAIVVSADAQHIYINAATSIQLHVGSSMIWMDSGGQINISGVNVAVNGSSSVTIKGGIVHSEADSEHQTKGAIVLSEGSATNTVRGGMVMLNP